MNHGLLAYLRCAQGWVYLADGDLRPMRIAVPASEIKGPGPGVSHGLLAYLRCAQGWVYLCAVRDAHSRPVLGYATGEQQSADLVITALDMAATTPAPSPQGSRCMLIEEHSSPPRNWPPTCAPSKEPCRWARPKCAGITP